MIINCKCDNRSRIFQNQTTAVPQNILDDVGEEEDGDEGNPYDSYSAPAVIETKENQEESEIMKLLGDTLDDLSDEDSPLQEKKHPISGKATKPEDLDLGSQNSDQDVPKPEDLESSPSEASMNSSPKLKPGVWPPPSDDVREQPDNSTPPLKSGHPSVLQKWQPKEWKKEEGESSSKPSKLDMTSWAKSVKTVHEVKRSIAQQELEALKKPVPKVKVAKPLPPPIAPKAKKEKTIVEEVPKNVFVALKPVKKQEVPPTKQEEIKNDASTIKLKKSSGKKVVYLYFTV